MTTPDHPTVPTVPPGPTVAPVPPAPREPRIWRSHPIILLAIVGFLVAILGAYLFSRTQHAEPPVFPPTRSSFDSAIYANGIIESDQPSGSNINLYPDVAGQVTRVFVHAGEQVSAGTPLFAIDDSIQRATTEQYARQADAAATLVQELKAQPRKETLEIAQSQVGLAEANLRAVADQYQKDSVSYTADPRSISKNMLDMARDAVGQAQSSLDVAQKTLNLTKAGAWQYDIMNQAAQAAALHQQYRAAQALLAKYTVRAAVDGRVLTVSVTPGSYVSTTGSYNPYTESLEAALVMSHAQSQLAVRCYIDEILIARLPTADHLRAQMHIPGTTVTVPLTFVRIEPFVTPKIELSNARQEQVDLRVLPVILRLDMQRNRQQLPAIYPGQLVDVYIGTTR